MQMAHVTRLVVVLSVVLIAAHDAAAQEVSFADLSHVVRRGETVIVTDASGRTLRGRLISATADGIKATVDVPGPGGGGAGWSRRDVQWTLPDVARVQRERSDSLWNGATLGGLAGGAAGFAWFMQSSGCDCTGADVALLVVGPFAGAGVAVGALIDAVTVSRHTVYRAGSGRGAEVRVAPVLAPSTRAVRVAIGF
jgi:hypothetical protein